MSVPKPPFDLKIPRTQATSSSSSPGSSSSGMSNPNSFDRSRPGSPTRDSKHGGADLESDDDLSPNPFERQMRERVREKTTHPLERRLAREQIREGWVENPRIVTPAHFVRGSQNKFDQSTVNGRGTCQETVHAFVCLRLAGYSIRQTLQILGSSAIRSLMPVWNAAKSTRRSGDFKGMNAKNLYTNGKSYEREMWDFPVPAIGDEGERFTDIAKDIRNHVDRLNRSEHSSPEQLGRFQHLGLYNPQENTEPIFYSQMIGCYPPRNFNQRVNAYFNVPISRGGCAVDNIHDPFALQDMPLKDEGDFRDRGGYRYIGSLQSHLFKRFERFSSNPVPHPHSGLAAGGSKGFAQALVRTATPFITLTTTSANRTLFRSLGPLIKYRSPFHMMVLDLSDPDDPGIFDPNYGWMGLHQGPCNLALEKVLFKLWEHYTGSESQWNESHEDDKAEKRIMKGERFLYTDDQDIDAFMMATQVFVQTLPRPSLPSPAQSFMPIPGPGR